MNFVIAMPYNAAVWKFKELNDLGRILKFNKAFTKIVRQTCFIKRYTTHNDCTTTNSRYDYLKFATNISSVGQSLVAPRISQSESSIQTGSDVMRMRGIL